jgi:catechol 2,3-dioxygenase-like lactoylglutathione lyase family enzyme
MTEERKMKKIMMFVLGLAAFLIPNASRAQLAAPNDAGASMGHVHLFVQDVDAAKKFWVAVGGTAFKFGPNEGAKFPGVLILVRKGEPAGGTVGSVINHIGFNVPNVPEALAKWKAAGLKTELGQNPGQCFLFTPDDMTRVEILENKSLTVPIAFHHVHFYVPDASGTTVTEIQSWYVKTFGAKPGKRGPFDAADVPGVNLTFTKSDTPTVPTKGRMLDHIGFEIKDLEAFCKKLEASGVKLDTPFTKRPELGISMAYITDPWGTYIELTEGLNKL